MGARQKEWARRKRLELMWELCPLGPRCALCGSTELLEFDCKIPVSNGHGKLDTSARMCFYRAQHRAGNLQVLCYFCNRSKGTSVTKCDVCGALLAEPERIWNQCRGGCKNAENPELGRRLEKIGL